MGIGWPASAKLEEFGAQIVLAFGHTPYQVGSSLDSSGASKRGWYDVDVRLLLPDDEYKAMGFGEPGRERTNGKWVAMCWAFSELGRAMTGLPIDFQIQQLTWANEHHGGEVRSALGVLSHLCRIAEAT